MKIGDVITVLGPHGPVSGVVNFIQPVAEARGFLAIDITTLLRTSYTNNPDPAVLVTPQRFVIRLETEGDNWIYGCDSNYIDAMRVAHALGDHTEVIHVQTPRRRGYSQNQASKRKKSTQ